MTCPYCSTDTEHFGFHWALEKALDPYLTSPANQIVVVSLWRYAKNVGQERVFLEVWGRKRAEKLRAETLRQRSWGSSTSRRPQRGRHHDSWAHREEYVTGRPWISNYKRLGPDWRETFERSAA